MTTRRSVLCLSMNFPWPADSGGCIRVDGLLRELATVYDVRLLVAREHDPARTKAIVETVQSETGITIETFPDQRRQRGTAAALALWGKSFAARMPPWVYCELGPELLSRYSELAPAADAVVLLQDFAGLYPLLAPTSSTPIIADKHVVMARPRFEGEGSTPRQKMLRQLTRSFEGRYLEKASDVVVTTNEDGRWLSKIYGRTPSAIIPTGVPVEAPRPSRTAGRRTVGWLSALDVVDNRQGLDRFLRSGWPQLAERGCELLVAGRNPPPMVTEMTNVPGVRLLGQVDSIRDFIAAIDVAVIPLWSGRGIKVKTLTFMGAGVPVAATPMAVEGMEIDDGRHCLVGETPEELADHVWHLLEDRPLADSIATAGRQLILDTFTWDAVGSQFNAVVQRAIESAD